MSFGFLREFFFPQYPILHRVRNSNAARGFGEPVILDFVSIFF